MPLNVFSKSSFMDLDILIVRRVGELAEAWNERDAGQDIREAQAHGARAADHLDRDLWDSIAEFLDRHFLEHEIGEAAEARHIPGALDRLDLRIGALAFVALVEPPGKLRHSRCQRSA